MHLLNLVSLAGVSGNEKAVRDYIFGYSQGKFDDIKTDAMGNLICFKRGNGKTTKKLMLCAHMDEVGLIVSDITEGGFLKFQTVGGIDPRILVSKRVLVGNKKINGVIGYKAVHLQEKAERSEAAKVKQLYIDIGSENKNEALKKVKLGDYVTFDSDYVEFGDEMIKAPALDDRAGCAILLELEDNIKALDFDLYFVFTTQEEVGTRGAKISANAVNPDFCIVLETTTCSDVFGTVLQEYATRLGEGAVLSLIDRGTYYNKKLTAYLYNLAVKNDIAVQYKQTAMGGNDAKDVHISNGGVKTAAVSIPARYIHSPSSVISKKDYFATKKLLELFLKEANECLNF